MKAVAYSCVASFALAAPSPDVLLKFHEFQIKWGRNYVGHEYTKRLGYFADQLGRIEDLQQQEQGTATYSHLGPFTDLSPEEMAQRLGFVQVEGADQLPIAPSLNTTLLAATFDWVTKGAVNPVKNQGQCGSCWSFSTACNLEGTGFVSTKKLVSLSEQNIMDCDKTCYSCNGGLPSLALKWSSQNGGVASEESYPYQAHDEACKTATKLTQNKGYIKISTNEDEIAKALVQYGPLSIAVDATPFQTYQGGVMNNPKCSKTRLDHAINMVGYGSTTIQYWKIRNSWSAQWGEKGYIRVARGDCTCGLCTAVVTATGVTISNHPSPPTPPPPPPTCKDDISWCPDSPQNWECQFLANVCQKSCGCCEANPPAGCSSSELTSAALPRKSPLENPHSVIDTIKKLVCTFIANGVVEIKAKQVICSRFSDLQFCDGLVGLLWKEMEEECSQSVVV